MLVWMTAGIAVSKQPGPPGLGWRRLHKSPSKLLRDADRAARHFRHGEFSAHVQSRSVSPNSDATDVVIEKEKLDSSVAQAYGKISLVTIAEFALDWLDEGPLVSGSGMKGRQHDLLPLPRVSSLKYWRGINFTSSEMFILIILNAIILGINSLYSRRGFANGEQLTAMQVDVVATMLGKLHRLIRRFFYIIF